MCGDIDRNTWLNTCCFLISRLRIKNVLIDNEMVAYISWFHNMF